METKPIYYRKSQAIKELEALATSKAKEKFPTIPENWLAPRTFKDNSANSLTKSIIQWIRLNGGQAERISNMGRVVNNSKKFTDVLGRARQVGTAKYIPGTGTKGTADISATIKGRSVKIEVKYGHDRQSDDQRQYQSDVERAGGVYFVARTFEQFMTWYKETFIALLILLSGCNMVELPTSQELRYSIKIAHCAARDTTNMSRIAFNVVKHPEQKVEFYVKNCSLFYNIEGYKLFNGRTELVYTDCSAFFIDGKNTIKYK